MMHRKWLAAAAASLLLLTGCYADFTMRSANLTLGYAPAYADPIPADERFVRAQTDFSVGLLRETVRNNLYSNAITASYPAAQALAMLANGTNGQTRQEFEKVLGNIPAAELNTYFSGLRYTDLWWPKIRFSLNSAVWFRGDRNLPAPKDFLQICTDSFDTGLYAGAYDAETLADMNHWMSSRSSGAVESLIAELTPETGIVALCEMIYRGSWLLGYTDDRVQTGKFVQIDGSVRETTMLYSDESVFLQSGCATGFTKLYRGAGGRQLEFCGILPNPGVGLWDYLAALCADNFPQPVPNAVAHVVMPAFQVSGSGKLSGALRTMGLYTAFEAGTADFSGAVPNGGQYLGDIWQYAELTVTRNGGSGGIFSEGAVPPSQTEPAQTDINGLNIPSAQPEIQEHDVMLNRPFLFFLRDAETGVPLMSGVVQTVG